MYYVVPGQALQYFFTVQPLQWNGVSILKLEDISLVENWFVLNYWKFNCLNKDLA